jgi:endo-1,3-1,4-beta-glycanase ExoK
MKNTALLKILITLICITLLITPTTAKQLTWKNQTWDIRSEYGSPGPNNFNASGAWIDNQNRMHLTIMKKGTKWYCSEIVSTKKFRYGTFTCKIASPVHTFDKNSVCSMFTYLDDTQELDIELTKWGASAGNNIWYSVQPYTKKGNSKGYYCSASGANTTHIIEWQPSYVRFTSKNFNGEVFADFKCKNSPRNPEYLIFNAWLQGNPSDGKNIDLIISDFSYKPSIF